MNITNAPEVLTAKELAELLRVDTRTIITYIKEGKIPALQVGKQYRIVKQNIIYLFKSLSSPSTSEER